MCKRILDIWLNLLLINRIRIDSASRSELSVQKDHVEINFSLTCWIIRYRFAMNVSPMLQWPPSIEILSHESV